ncbi:MAG TPA: GNAT family N-acetyltransferase, partial [Pseudoneobacillus sp.]|nr:GNAT family N-acetyltransferase [Pseudoneobacillus sp.]
MQEVSFVKGYQHDEKLRKSFNLLATLIFGIEFESWYQKGYWRDKYIPYSFVVQDQVVANVSVNLIDMTINNSEKSAVQIGTVMTHPDHRGKGYSQLLMNKVLTDYANADLFYLFANETVLDFYPKFGFQRMAETSF